MVDGEALVVHLVVAVVALAAVAVVSVPAVVALVAVEAREGSAEVGLAEALAEGGREASAVVAASRGAVGNKKVV